MSAEHLAAWTCLVIWVVVCVHAILPHIEKRAGFLHFPFLATAGLLLFYFPQAVGTIRSDGAPWYATCRWLVVAALCVGALERGWKSGRPRGPRIRILASGAAIPVSMLYRLGVVYLIVGLGGLYKLAAISGGIRGMLLDQTGYAMEWRGTPVAYLFFASFLTPGAVLTALCAAQMHSALRIVPAVVVLALELASALLGMRRTGIVNLVLLSLLVMYFSRRYLPDRRVMAAAGLAVVVAMFVMPALRGYRVGRGELPGAEAPREALVRIVREGGAELRDGAYLVQVTAEEGVFQYGIGFFNSWVRFFVPRLLVGDEGKEALLVAVPDAGHVGPQPGEVANRYGWRIDPYTVPTGPASVFQQFWYVGAVCYFFLARWFRRLWEKALQGDIGAAFYYCAAQTMGIAAVVSDVFVIYGPLFALVLPTWLASRLLQGLRRRAESDGRPRAGTVLHAQQTFGNRLTRRWSDGKHSTRRWPVQGSDRSEDSVVSTAC